MVCKRRGCASGVAVGAAWHTMGGPVAGGGGASARLLVQGEPDVTELGVQLRIQ